jgi:hypothetical protein
MEWERMGRRRPKGQKSNRIRVSRLSKKTLLRLKFRLEQDQRDIIFPSPLPDPYGRAQKKTPERGLRESNQ